ncbi:hypothetical protein CPC08DRAFT_706711 [Agrocybe pediades]|nr:hypothetical protein CPC08DRAFT_706711 [Agrocybe pediades]
MKSIFVFLGLLPIFFAATSGRAAPADNVNDIAEISESINSGLLFNATQNQEAGDASCYYDGVAPFCAGRCPLGYNERNKDNCGGGHCCWTGYKAYCCRDGT